MLIMRVLACTAFAAVMASGLSAVAQDSPRARVPSKIRAISPAQGLSRPMAAPAKAQASREGAAGQSLNVAGIPFTCDAQCFSCNFGDCDLSQLGNDECDCACQFADNADCGSNCNCPSNCDFCWCNTSAENNCPTGWNGADDGCDCACQFTDSDCSTTAPTGACCSSTNECAVRTHAFCEFNEGAYAGDNTLCGQVNCSARCAAGCEACWIGTPREGACDPDYEGDGFCDCGCQFVDPDCGPQGACCLPANGECDGTTQLSCVSYLAGVFRGVGTSCGNANCQRCDPGCDWCWKDTVGEHACLPGWADDGECDCGCQFADLDCDPGVCGDLVCDGNARQCADDCKDLRAVAAFQNCFRPGAAEPPQCYDYVYANPIGIGLEDYAAFRELISGP